jgi:hypothetical protein
LSTHGTHLHDRIISLRWEFLNHKSSIAPLLFIEMSVASQESERSCICVLEVSSQESERSCICVLEVSSQESERSCICVLKVSILPFFYNFSIVFWNCSDSMAFLCSLFYYMKKNNRQGNCQV